MITSIRTLQNGSCFRKLFDTITFYYLQVFKHLGLESFRIKKLGWYNLKMIVLESLKL